MGMRIVGLTGGIACGKSNVSDALREMGAAVVDGDKLSRELTDRDGAALPALRAAFGPGVFRPDGTLDRRALGRVVFADDEARARLDALMHPYLESLILSRIGQARENGDAVCVLDMPLLYEAGLDRLCDTVWCVYLPEETQLRRLMARDGFTREEAEARLRSQLPAAEKARRAQVVIDTGGSIDYTKAMLPALYAKELRQAGLSDQGGPYGNESRAAPDDPAG